MSKRQRIKGLQLQAKAGLALGLLSRAHTTTWGWHGPEEQLLYADLRGAVKTVGYLHDATEDDIRLILDGLRLLRDLALAAQEYGYYLAEPMPK